MSKIVDFPKRIDIWRKYRDEINKISLKIGSSFSSDKKLSRLVSQINAISPSILKNVSNDIELSESFNIQSNLLEQYKSLRFSINSLDSNLLNQINEGIEKAELQRNKYFLINNDGTLSTDSLKKFKSKDDLLLSVNKSISDIEYRIQKFPKTAGEDLATLNGVLETTKINLKNNIFPEKIDTTDIQKTMDWKIVYWTCLSIFVFAAIGIIVTMVLLFTL